jgi:hypothetical protein
VSDETLVVADLRNGGSGKGVRRKVKRGKREEILKGLSLSFTTDHYLATIEVSLWKKGG